MLFYEGMLLPYRFNEPRKIKRIATIGRTRPTWTLLKPSDNYITVFSNLTDHCISSYDAESQNAVEVQQYNENMHFDKKGAITIIAINYNFQNIFHSGLGKIKS